MITQEGSATQSLELAAVWPGGEELSVTTPVRLEPMELTAHPPVRWTLSLSSPSTWS